VQNVGTRFRCRKPANAPRGGVPRNLPKGLTPPLIAPFERVMSAGDDPNQPPAKTPRPLTEAAQRALLEAAERRAERERQAAERASGGAKEINGPKGLDPARYGDWERKGIASDF
jgi:hypothetical protein